MGSTSPKKQRPHLGRCGREKVTSQLQLEANASADLDLPVAAELFLRRAGQSAESGASKKPRGANRVEPLVMVKDVSEDTLEFQANAFRHDNILPDAEVHVPVRQAKDVAI